MESVLKTLFGFFTFELFANKRSELPKEEPVNIAGKRSQRLGHENVFEKSAKTVTVEKSVATTTKRSQGLGAPKEKPAATVTASVKKEEKKIQGPEHGNIFERSAKTVTVERSVTTAAKRSQEIGAPKEKPAETIKEELESGSRKDESLYPNRFYVKEAIANGSCFFDSFRQSLEQQKGDKVTVKELREVCKEFAQENSPQ